MKQNSVSELLEYGIREYYLKKYSNSIKILTDVINIRNDNYEAYYYRALSLQDNSIKRFEESLNDFDIAIKIKPDFEEALNERSFLKIRLERFEDSILDAQQVIKMNPKSSIAYSNMALANNYLGYFDNSLKLYEKAIEIDSKNIGANEGIALVQIKKGNYKEAIRRLENTIKIISKSKSEFLRNTTKDEYLANIYMNISVCYLNLNILQVSFQYIQYSLELDDKNPYSLYVIALLYYRTGDIEKSLHYIKKALKISFNLPEIIQLLGNVYYNNLSNISFAIVCFKLSQKCKNQITSHTIISEWRLGNLYHEWNQQSNCDNLIKEYFPNYYDECYNEIIGDNQFKNRKVISEHILANVFINNINSFRTDLKFNFDDYKLLLFIGKLDDAINTLENEKIWFANPLIFLDKDIYEVGLIRKGININFCEKIVFENVRIRCLSLCNYSSNVSQLDHMWEDYANGYKGIAFEIKIDKNWLIDEKIYISKIIYNDAKTKSNIVNIDSPEDVIIDGLCTKKLKNENENELRLIKFGKFDKNNNGIFINLKKGKFEITRAYLGNEWYSNPIHLTTTFENLLKFKNIETIKIK